MADIHNPNARSKNMRAIRSSGTSIENKVQEIIESLGIKYRKQVSSLPGKPDFVIDDYQAILFVHGCFWHGHNCHVSNIPMTRTDYWLNKINKNINRDYMVMDLLSNLGWKILILWECALRGRKKISDKEISERIEEWLCEDHLHAEVDMNGISRIVLNHPTQ
ncbi:very short patch repair endonuclease [Xenorhabdus bovienii]|uniref:Very short patch repair endonuclease n=1 Tax=Xenorhabdus bovienii str. feltiae Moldova TaxID=1398200 RepID=A0A077NCA2_XENBV|nr:DNA mismatch endonuclease Vsr [Xenorhabdus bovienii]CDG99792.1 DNA mismatch endonuclease of very short patch repair [Xenorhabdus bovienii str. feltiae Moldova]